MREKWMEREKGKMAKAPFPLPPSPPHHPLAVQVQVHGRDVPGELERQAVDGHPTCRKKHGQGRGTRVGVGVGGGTDGTRNNNTNGQSLERGGGRRRAGHEK